MHIYAEVTQYINRHSPPVQQFIFRKQWIIGDKILIGNEEIEIAGLLKYDPFSSNGLTNGKITLITSGETFTRLTGITGYSLIMVQTTSQVTDEDVSALCNTVVESGN